MQTVRAYLSLCAIVSLSASILAADETVDLKRVTPVPADQQIPIGDFFRPPLWRGAALNPSGTHVAGLVTGEQESSRLLVYELQTKKMELLGEQGDRDVYAFSWLNDKRLVAQLSARKLFGIGMLATEVGALNKPYVLLQYVGPTLVSVPLKNRAQPLVWMQRDGLENGRDGGVVSVNTDIKSGQFVDLFGVGRTSGDSDVARESNRKHIVDSWPVPKDGLGTGYLGDREGQLAYAFMSDEGVQAAYRLMPDRTWSKCPIDLETTDIIGPGDRPGELAAAVPGEPGQPRALRFLDAASGKPGEVLLQDKGYDFTGWLYREPVARVIVGAVIHRAVTQAVWFDETYRSVQKMVDAQFPGQIARIIGNSEKGDIFLVETYSDRQPSSYHFFDLKNRTGGLIKNSAPWIDPARMRPMQIIKFKTREGKLLDAYITLPEGASKTNPAPLVVLSHGGPWVRDDWGFDGEVQFLASRGYAVLQPNYRGSPGYDWMFPEEDKWDFLKMSDDVIAATKAAIATGMVDRQRIGIMGASFGAYLALAGVTREPEMYRCAVGLSGVYDWEAMLRERRFDKFDDPSYGRLVRKLGDPKVLKDKFEAISPARHIDKVRVPVFVSHGREDQVAVIGQSRQLISELDRHHVPHEVMLVSDEGHGMGHVRNRVEQYARIEAFLAKYMQPLAKGAAKAP